MLAMLSPIHMLNLPNFILSSTNEFITYRGRQASVYQRVTTSVVATVAASYNRPQEIKKLCMQHILGWTFQIQLHG